MNKAIAPTEPVQNRSQYLRIMAKLQACGAIDPPIVTAIDGSEDVDFFWNTDRIYLDLGTDGDSFSWYARFPDGAENTGSLPLDQSLPKEIIEAVLTLNSRSKIDRENSK